MAIEPTVQLLKDFVKERTPSESDFVNMYFESGSAFVSMKKAVSDGMGGYKKMKAEKLMITFGPILDIKQPVTEDEVEAHQMRLMEMNPKLKSRCKDCVKSACDDPVAGNEYAWHTKNGYARSVVLKFPKFAEYCANGVNTLGSPRKRKAEEPQLVAMKQPRTTLPSPHHSSTAWWHPSWTTDSATGKRALSWTTVESPTIYGRSEKGALTFLDDCQAAIEKDPSSRKMFPPPSPSTSHDGKQQLVLQPSTPKRGEAPGRRNPPNACVKLLRTAATCAPLMKYLKDVDKLTPMGKPHWNAIKAWTKTEEGMDWLRNADIDPLGVHLDHVVAQKGIASGLDSVFNCYFLPPAPNSWFGQYDTPEKRAYMGEQAVNISKRFTEWVRGQVVMISKQNPALFDQSKFDPIFS